MIRCLAVDDEAYAAEIISNYIKKTPFLQFVAQTTDVFEALSLIQEGKIDLLFLDIQMPELTGIQFLKMCGDRCKVILTTAYSEYALEGFNLDVVDYLLKPIPYERFYKAALKASQLLGTLNPPHQENPTKIFPHQNDFIFVKGDTKRKFIKIDLQDILYIEGLKNYVSIYTTDQRIVTYQTLRDLEETLPATQFYRVHRSYIVSLAKISLVNGDSLTIGRNIIPIGATYKNEFFKIIQD